MLIKIKNIVAEKFSTIFCQMGKRIRNVEELEFLKKINMGIKLKGMISRLHISLYNI